MQLILLERIEHLGQMGDVVRVRPGYARNYLLPQKKAVRATEDNKKRFEEQRGQLEATNLERRTEAEAVGAKLDGVAVVLIRQAGETGQLYGSVTARDIADAVTAAGFSITRQQVRLDQPIKSLGLHRVAVPLHPEVIVHVTVNVARSQDEAEIQSRGGKVGDAADEIPALSLEDEIEAMFEESAGDQAQEDLAEEPPA